MASPPPTILALQLDSAWVVIVAVSAIALPLVLAFRRLIQHPGGRASAFLLALPLALPLVAAALYGHPMLPEVAVLRPAAAALGSRAADLQDLLLLRAGRADVLIPYAPAASTGPWPLVAAAALSGALILRRMLGAIALARMVRRSRPLGARELDRVGDVIDRLATRAGLERTPRVLVMAPPHRGALAAGSRPGAVLVSADVLQALDDPELEAVFAHEIAHLAVRDARLLALCGLLRDLVAWNPVTHLAFRHLTLDREIEADRAAAALTGKPLAIASSLLKMCELLGRRRRAPVTALAFGATRDRLRRRVSSLLALADGAPVATRPNGLPFVAAACVASIVALQLGSSLAQRGGEALAFVWGGSAATETRVWTPEIDPWRIKREVRDGRTRIANRSRLTLDQPLPPQALAASLRAAPAVQEKDLGTWMRALSRATSGRDSAPFDLSRRAGWRVQPLFGEASIGSLGVYSVEPFRLDPRVLRP